MRGSLRCEDDLLCIYNTNAIAEGGAPYVAHIVRTVSIKCYMVLMTAHGARGLSAVSVVPYGALYGFLRFFAVPCVSCMVLYRSLSVCPSVRRIMLVRSRVRTLRTERPSLRY